MLSFVVFPNVLRNLSYYEPCVEVSSRPDNSMMLHNLRYLLHCIGNNDQLTNLIGQMKVKIGLWGVYSVYIDLV